MRGKNGANKREEVIHDNYLQDGARNLMSDD